MNFYYTLFITFIIITHHQSPQIDNHIIPVYGNASLGYYYVNLYVGTPPQEQSVIIDTGSGQLAVPCSKCTSCGRRHIHPPFDIMKSKTNKILTCASQQQMCKESCFKSDANPCKFSISYAQGSSLSGIVMKDFFQFEKGTIGENIQTAFGCTTKQTNLFYTQAANGIFGLAPNRNSKLLQILYQKHSKFTHQDLAFSICLASNGGQLSIGGINKNLNTYDQPIKTTYSDYRNVYSLNFIGNIRINKTILRSTQDLGYYGVFIDSGSTFTYFKYDKFSRLQKQLQNICAYHSSQCLVARSKSEKNCFKITPNQGQTIKKTINHIFSPIQIQINGKVVKWTADKYFVLRSLKNKEICLAIYGLDRYLLGANWMVNKNIAFNLREKTVQIYTEAACKAIQKHPSQQLSLYTDEQVQGSLQYFQAIIHQDDFFLTKLIILIFIIGLVLGLLIIIAKNAQSKVQSKDKFSTIVVNSAEDQSSVMKIRQHQGLPSSERFMINQTQKIDVDTNQDKIENDEQQEYQIQLQKNQQDDNGSKHANNQSNIQIIKPQEILPKYEQ